jgi:predicted RNA methylase
VSTRLQEVDRGERIKFGARWPRLLASISDQRIAAAEDSLRAMLSNIGGKRFPDIGSGSGHFSLTAHRLGATAHSFDFDPEFVDCTQELKRRYSEKAWTIAGPSTLDPDYAS